MPCLKTLLDPRLPLNPRLYLKTPNPSQDSTPRCFNFHLTYHLLGALEVYFASTVTLPYPCLFLLPPLHLTQVLFLD